MARVRSKNMLPELIVRSLVFKLGYRYRLHARDLPGCPDLVFRPRRRVIFVHGCFWHRIDDELTLIETAQSVELSPDHFARMFRKSTGETPHQFVLRVRIERARESGQLHACLILENLSRI